MKRTIIRCLLLVLISISSAFVMAQERRTITGQVRDANGEPLAGVSFVVKGTSTAGSTDENGNFRVAVTGASPIIVFTTIGFLEREFTVGADNNVVVVMEDNPGELSEVIVTGFGVKKDIRKLSYSVQEVAGEELARANTVNLANALQGKVAGVMVNQGAGGPSSSSRIRIRGNTSIRPNASPLFVIDGVLIRPGATGADSWGDARDFGNDLKNLNPDDYESVTVLKGSAATALYGSEAQFGVILIQTKKGRERKGLGVNVSQTATFERAYRLPDLQNQYGGGVDPFFQPGGPGGNRRVDPQLGPYYSFGPKFDGQPVLDVDGRTIPWVANNLLDMYRTGQFYNTNVAIEGGSDRTTVRFSYTKTRNSSVLPNNAFDRNVFNLRATQKLNNFVNVDAVVTYTNSTTRNPILQGGNNSPLFRLAFSNSRHYDVNYYQNVYIDSVRGGMIGASGNATTNPYARGALSNMWWNIYENDVSQREDNLRANIDLNVNILPWLNLLVRGNINSNVISNENKSRGQLPGFLGGGYGIFQSNNKYVRMQSLLTASKRLGEDFEGNLTVGGETNRGLGGYQSNISTNGGLKVADIFALTNSVNPLNATGGVFPNNRLDAVYAYGDVTWRDQLTLNFSARNDWDSKLTYPDGSGDFRYFYPSVGVAWIFSESFKNTSAFDFISFGKLRASLGYTGAGPANIFETSTGLGYTLLGNFQSVGTTIPRYGFLNNNLGNLNLKPQRTREFEIGADIRFLNNRLGVDFAFYKKNTFNEIMGLTTPPESGVSSRIINAGNIENKGFEIILNATPIQGRDFSWNTLVNFTRNRNRIIDLDAANGVTSLDLDLAFGADVKSVAQVGRDYGTIVTGYAFAHYQAKDASGNPVSHANNGQRLLKQNGVFWRSGDAGQGARELGTMMERFLLSNIHNFNYKGISLSFQVDSKIGGLMASATHQYGSQYGSFESTLFGRDEASGGVTFTDAAGNVRSDGIIPDGVFSDDVVLNGVNVGGMTYAQAVEQGLTIPMTARAYYEGLGSWGTGIREYSVFENSWVVVREIAVGYNIPKAFTDRLKMNSLRVSLVGRNLWYLYNTAKDNINPEGIFSSRAGTFAEYGGLPFIRNIGVTVSAGF